ncbi:uncharacterized protein FIBRA_03232 [Fibroporia radiculosa]|uniref:Heterokaryon incompatibility domain-containing protein n=1 Tax=Fibroporia radiculosa TaxID=599839 RepID=J4H2A5_9APHY|nr:uncharacterized protein FIBRA_03232 [Fibroporia radiculosa]CCM01184.1 predicted protein [Fibroporia radiculosa]
MSSEGLIYILDEYIANRVPARLIKVDEMKVVTRDDVKEYYRPMFEALKYPPIEMHETVRYAILSHRWLSRGEPTFQDMSEQGARAPGTGPDPEGTIQTQNRLSGPGYDKLVAFCTKAKEYDCPFAWSDTCCIDKRSSAELDEAIRSMFWWYRNASICITHLGTSSSPDDMGSDPWFTRGWTLQELLGPRRTKFFGRDWAPLVDGDNDKVLADPTNILAKVSTITGISDSEICHFVPGMQRVAERMGWASKRRTTKVEDMAYSLIGIFDISLDIQYGEGDVAFSRLMEAIVRRYSGWDIHAWKGRCSKFSRGLASSPSCYPPLLFNFLDNNPDNFRAPLDYGYDETILTNKGLRLKVLLVPMKLSSDPIDKEMHDSLFTFRAKQPKYVALEHPGQAVGKVKVEIPSKLEDQCYPFPPGVMSMYNWAVGVLDYLRDDSEAANENEGAIEPNDSEYTAFLLFQLLPEYRRPNIKPWYKLATEQVVKVSCLKELKDNLTTIAL